MSYDWREKQDYDAHGRGYDEKPSILFSDWSFEKPLMTAPARQPVAHTPARKAIVIVVIRPSPWASMIGEHMVPASSALR